MRAREQGKTFEEAKVDLIQGKQPSQEFVTPEQITGAALNIDGGWWTQ